MTLFAAQRDAQLELMQAAESLSGWSPLGDAMRRFAANHAAIVGVCGLLFLAIMAAIAPFFSPHVIDDMAWDAIGIPPTLENSHWFGTDDTGRDMWVLTWMGARVSLTIGVLTTVVALSIGVVYGATAGYLGGRADMWMMRFVDVLYALPLLFFIIILVTVFGRNIYLVFVAIGCVEWLTMSRIVRGQTMSIKRKDFIEAAVTSGLSPAAIVRRHVIPNAVGPVIVYVTTLVPTNILVESYLSFLGLGVQEPLTSWGVLISRGANSIETTPWLLLIPAVLLAITMFCFNFIGDGLRDALDPKDR